MSIQDLPDELARNRSLALFIGLSCFGRPLMKIMTALLPLGLSLFYFIFYEMLFPFFFLLVRNRNIVVFSKQSNFVIPFILPCPTVLNYMLILIYSYICSPVCATVW